MGLQGIRALIPPELGGTMDFKDISPELREKAKACKTPEEILALAKKEGYKLSDEEMQAVSGGWTAGSKSDWDCAEEYQT